MIANDKIKTNDTKVWTSNQCLYIQGSMTEQVYIYTIDGRLQQKFHITKGEHMIQLSPGSYLVVVKNKSFKVVL